jgi:hypothetical protein
MCFQVEVKIFSFFTVPKGFNYMGLNLRNISIYKKLPIIGEMLTSVSHLRKIL